MLDTKRREVIALLGAGGLLLAVKIRRARAQQPAMPVIGFLSSSGSPADRARFLTAFRQGIREIGYCYDFPPRISGHLFASGSARSSSVRVSQLDWSLPIDRTLAGHVLKAKPISPGPLSRGLS